ncbi:MAG: hypothetical protein CMG84_12210 [Marinobacter sp.]|nr:hypothetical protein [Marinobacter sp.]
MYLTSFHKELRNREEQTILMMYTTMVMITTIAAAACHLAVALVVLQILVVRYLAHVALQMVGASVCKLAAQLLPGLYKDRPVSSLKKKLLQMTNRWKCQRVRLLSTHRL